MHLGQPRRYRPPGHRWHPGNDVICGGAGNDNINGSAGNDTIYGGAGNDTTKLGPHTAPDTVVCGTGDDTATGVKPGDVISKDCEHVLP